ncbi:MAG: hypothetical protein BGN82_09575 [Alphaproteobacteria bacterium 65-7]|nr:MAG: hypothetical protein BGN82_09575 [Alphaproteobacteria bacterium 65-7]
MSTESGLIRPFLIPGLTPPGPEELRRARAKRGLSWVLVGLLHVALFFSFVIAFRLPEDRQRDIVETILMLAPAGQSSRPTDIINPDTDKDAARRMYSAPITVPPPIVPPLAAPPQGRGLGGVDVLGAVGRVLSCGAGSWEHLTQAERAQCYNWHPWVAGKLPNGNLVMVPGSQLPRLREPPPDTGFAMNSGADRVQRDVQMGYTPGTGNCPILQNVPCLHVTPGMRAMEGN